MNPNFIPALLITEKTFPKPKDDLLIGNDDSNVDEETNDPYANNQTLTSDDPVKRAYGFAAGHENATHENKFKFEEFVRLEINKKWFLVSDDDDWEVHFKFKKEKIDEAEIGPEGIDVNRDGSVGGPINEGVLGRDFNGDNDEIDDITRWVNDESTSKN